VNYVHHIILNIENQIKENLILNFFTNIFSSHQIKYYDISFIHVFADSLRNVHRIYVIFQLLEYLDPRLIVSAHTHHGCYRLHENGAPEYTVASYNWRNKKAPSFLLVRLPLVSNLDKKPLSLRIKLFS
jgi:hypothetical protein